jgi:uncharacterized membrane protein YozB (DUF420 family)
VYSAIDYGTGIMTQIFYYLIPFFMALTVIALVFGLYGLVKGGKYSGNFSNNMMRKRILFQFCAVLVAMIFLYLSQKGFF